MIPVSPAEIARRALADHLAALSPAELLARYATRRDPEAFAGLVQQFGPMVFGVCRRVLGPSPDADDAFQAVFLALARQADSFRDAAALPAWLHRVALRTAHKARARRTDAAPLPDALADPSDPLANVAWKDVRRALDEELDALPERFRGPVVLCWLDGLTQDEAATRLGFSLNTLKRRLDDARELLRSRLVRRGLAPALAAVAVLDATGLRAVGPDSLALLAVELGVGAPAAPAVEALAVFVAATAPGHRYLKVGLVLALVAGTATAGVVALTFTSPPEFPAVSVRPPESPRDEPRLPVVPAPRLQLAPLRFEPVGKPLPAAGRVVALTFSRDGRTLISGDKSLRLLDAETGNLRADYTELHTPKPTRPPKDDFDRWDMFPGADKIRNVVLGPDGQTLVWVNGLDGWDGGSPLHKADVLLWDFATGRKLRQVRLYPETEFSLPGYRNVGLAALSPNGETLATTQKSGEVHLWDVAHWWWPSARRDAPHAEWIKEPRFVFRGHTRQVESEGVYVPMGVPPGQYVPKRVTTTTTVEDVFRALAFSPDGTTLAAAAEDKVLLWDVKTGREKAVLPLHPVADRYGYDGVGIAFSPDGRFLASVCKRVNPRPGVIKVWDLTAGTSWTSSNPDPDRDRYLGPGVAFHPDGRTLVVGGTGEITVWDAPTGRKLETLSSKQGWIQTLAFSPDGRTLASGAGYWGSDEKTIQLWAVSRPKE